MNRPANRYRTEHRAIEAAANVLSGHGEHELATDLWAAAATLKALGEPTSLVALRKLICDTADRYAADEDAVVVLDDVVGDEIARVVAQRYGLGAG